MAGETPLRIRLPVHGAPLPEGGESFAYGASYGYSRDAIEAATIRYWPGQEIWLPPGAAVQAMLKGTVAFVPAWEPVPRESVSEEEREVASWDPIVAIGDALVLRPLPAELVRLAGLLPSGAPFPQQIVYHNVDRESATRAIRAVILSDQRVHQPFFLADDDSSETGELDADGNLRPDLFERRVREWTDSQWAQGLGSGVLVEAGSALGEATEAPTPPSDTGITLPGEPPGMDSGWRRLTLSMREDDGCLFNPNYFLYLVYRSEEADLWERPETDNPFVTRAIEQVSALPLIEVTSQLREGWAEDNPEESPDDGMPPAMPEARLALTLSSMEKAVSAAVDPHREHLWRSQSPLPMGDYEVRCRGTTFYKQGTPDAPARNVRVTADPPPEPAFRLGLAPAHLIPVDGVQRFILGVNYEAMRRKNHWDLARNEIKAILDGWHPTGWVDRDDSFTAEAHKEPPLSSVQKWSELEWDFWSIAQTGARAVRLWAFEGLEGLQFSFGASQLAAEKARADSPSGSPFLKKFNIGGKWEYACSQAEYAGLKASWGGDIRVTGLDTRLLENASRVQRLARSNGLWVLWTLWTHFAEGGDWWADFAAQAHNRLPFGMWVYRDVMLEAVTRDSYMTNALLGFVAYVESERGILGYEVVNEADIVWRETRHSWALTARDETHVDWMLDGSQIRRFVSESVDTVRAALGPVNRDRRLILCGVLGTQPRDTRHELDLLDPAWSPSVRLSASALTRYSVASRWSAPYSTSNPNGTHDVAQEAWLRRHPPGGPGRCLFTEAGDDPWSLVHGVPQAQEDSVEYDCAAQRAAVAALLEAVRQKNYGGVFIWHYNNPRREVQSTTGRATYWADQNALTERLINGDRTVAAAGHAGASHVRRFAAGRPACQAIFDFADLPHISQLLLPDPR